MNKSKQKGTRAETKLVNYFNDNGLVARRQALAGHDDMGDIEVRCPGSDIKIIVEAKAGKQTASPNRTQIEEWCRQALVETKNASANVAALVVVRYRRSLEDADVYIVTPDKCRTHWYLDDWVDSLL